MTIKETKRANEIFAQIKKDGVSKFSIFTHPFTNGENLYLREEFKKVGTDWELTYHTNHSFGCCPCCGNIRSFNCMSCDGEIEVFTEEELIEHIALSLHLEPDCDILGEHEYDEI